MMKGENLKAKDLNFADITWNKSVQTRSFATEHRSLVRGCERNRRVKQINLFIDGRPGSFAVSFGQTMWTLLNKARILLCCQSDINTRNCWSEIVMSAFSTMVLEIHWIHFEKDTGCYEEQRLSKESSGNVPYVEDKGKPFTYIPVVY